MVGRNANQDLVYNMILNPAGMRQGATEAEKIARQMERRFKEQEAAQQRIFNNMAELGAPLAVTGAAIAYGLTLVTRAAIEWESAWVGVTKVISGTSQQLQFLEEQFRELAKTVPQSHKEIAAVAAAAAQLGVSKQNLLLFTQVMLDLGVATNLTSEEASFALARMMNIMGTAETDVRRLGSAIVALGNTSATTEQDIVAMGLRIAGAGNTIGMSEADVLGYAAALSSVGIEAEAGGTAISTTFMRIAQAVAKGGDDLDKFAEVAGMSAEEFAGSFAGSPARAIATFIGGLGEMQAAGGDVFATLQGLGITEIRMRDAMLRLAGAQGVLNKSLDTANEGWDKNAALLKEANARYGTAAAKIAIAGNVFNDVAIDMGESFLPVLANVVGGIAEVVGWFEKLPDWMKVGITSILGLAAAFLLLLGGAMLVVPGLLNLQAALNGLSGPVARASQTMVDKLVTTLSGPVGVGMAAGLIALTVVIGMVASAAAEARQNTKQLTTTFDELTGAVTENTRMWVAQKLADEGAFAAANRLGISNDLLVDALMGRAEAQEQVNAILSQTTALSRQSSEEQAQHVADLGKVKDIYGELSGNMADAREVWEGVNGAMKDSSEAIDALEPKEQQLAKTLGLSAEGAKEAAKQVNELSQALNDLLGTVLGVQRAEDDLLDAIDEFTASVAENGESFEGNSEAARNNRDAVDALLQSYIGLIDAQLQNGASAEELVALNAQLKEQFISQMRAAGMAEDEILRYAAAFDQIPSKVTTTLDLQVSFNNLWKEAIPGEFDGALPGSRRRAAGGWVTGPGGPTDDRVPILASNGEYVVRASAARRWAGLLHDINSGRTPSAAVSGQATAASGGNTINVYVSSYSDRFDMGQVMGHLAFMGAV